MDTKTLCLAILIKGDASGYEIKKALGQQPYELFQDTGFGSIYPALAQLFADGLVTVRQESQAKRPDKKVYSLTEAGRQALLDALARPHGPDRLRSDFLFVILHGDLLEPDQVMAAIDRRIAELETALTHLLGIEISQKGAACRFTYHLGVDCYGAQLNYLRAHREELHRALLDERAQPRAAE